MPPSAVAPPTVAAYASLSLSEPRTSSAPAAVPAETGEAAAVKDGNALLNALYLTGLLADLGFLALGVGGLKVALYVFRKAAFHRGGRPPRMGLSLLRLLLGFAAPAMLAGCAPALAALGAALGDLVDRSEYYDEMDADSPARDLLRALRERLSAAPTPPRGSPPP